MFALILLVIPALSQTRFRTQIVFGSGAELRAKIQNDKCSFNEKFIISTDDQESKLSAAVKSKCGDQTKFDLVFENGSMLAAFEKSPSSGNSRLSFSLKNLRKNHPDITHFSFFPIPRAYYVDMQPGSFSLQARAELEVGSSFNETKCFDINSALRIPIEKSTSGRWRTPGNVTIYGANGRKVENVQVYWATALKLSQASVDVISALNGAVGNADTMYPLTKTKVEFEFQGTKYKTGESRRKRFSYTYDEKEVLFMNGLRGYTRPTVMLGANYFSKFVTFFDVKNEYVGMCNPNWNFEYVE